MRRFGWLMLIGIFLFFGTSSSSVSARIESFAPSPYIYKLKIAGCSSGPPERRQTGFRANGKKGIVTALHGVVGCTTITAQSDGQGLQSFNDLTIAEVDIDRDMALLSSQELAILPTEGFAVAAATQLQDYEGLYVIGYPLDLLRQKPTTQITVTENTQLNNLLSTDLLDPFAKRSSPAIWIQVLSVEGHLLPGHSGAPLLNGNNQVVGVANGGLEKGFVEISWATPWETIAWKPVSLLSSPLLSQTDVTRLQLLAENRSEELFYLAIPEDFKETTPVVINLGDYVQVAPAVELVLYERTGANQRKVTSAVQNSILKVIGGPVEIQGVKWWEVRKIDGAQKGWVAESEDSEKILLQPLPKLSPGAYVVSSWGAELNRFKAANSNAETMDVIKVGEELKVLVGPQENQGLLWCLLIKKGETEGGWVIFAGNQGVNLEISLGPSPDLPTVVPSPTTIPPVTSTPTPTPTQSLYPMLVENFSGSGIDSTQWDDSQLQYASVTAGALRFTTPLNSSPEFVGYILDTLLPGAPNYFKQLSLMIKVDTPAQVNRGWLGTSIACTGSGHVDAFIGGERNILLVESYSSDATDPVRREYPISTLEPHTIDLVWTNTSQIEIYIDKVLQNGSLPAFWQPCWANFGAYLGTGNEVSGYIDNIYIGAE